MHFQKLEPLQFSLSDLVLVGLLVIQENHSLTHFASYRSPISHASIYLPRVRCTSSIQRYPLYVTIFPKRLSNPTDFINMRSGWDQDSCATYRSIRGCEKICYQSLHISIRFLILSLALPFRKYEKIHVNAGLRAMGEQKHVRSYIMPVSHSETNSIMWSTIQVGMNGRLPTLPSSQRFISASATLCIKPFKIWYLHSR